ncbi:Alpha/Beta hydrolase protein [Macrophomina phaseolina]|uniref:Alpha/Beta hydrolase protein n=1 Tax=Macrophomina phaseolina TaxID=35725 RepID=A0ABQ8G977_9PEZI|nr:Alpha/Beta hydrolase protein [Macrophomina phaseolina]
MLPSTPLSDAFLKIKDPGHEYAKTNHIPFLFARQTLSSAPFGYDFFVSLPPGYTKDPEKEWPLVIFLHGAGESQRKSDESYPALRHGVSKIILCYDKLASGDAPIIQIPKAERLREGVSKSAKDDLSPTPVPPDVCRTVAEEFITLTPVLDMRNGYGWNPAILTSLLDEVLPHFRVDLSRIHLTGFSMGGGGTWSLALHTPNRFATLTPVCGYGDAARAGLIAHIPQWVHHGELDTIIDIRESERMVKALKKKGAHVRFTKYPHLAHDSWTEAYNDIELWRWMLEARKQEQGELRVLPDEDKAAVA